MAILTVAQLREHVASAMPDTAIQRLLDASEEDILEWAGPVSAQTELFDGGMAVFTLPRLASAVVSIRQDIYGTPLVLAADDYALDGYLVRRLTNGTNPLSSFGSGTAEVVYTPQTDTARRQRVQVALMKLDIAFEGVASQGVGDWSASFGDKSYEDKRAEVLASLRPFSIGIVGG